MTKLRVTWKKSWIGCVESQRATIRSLGLRRLNHSVELEDNPGVRGMIEKVQHLVSVDLVEDAESQPQPPNRRSQS